MLVVGSDVIPIVMTQDDGSGADLAAIYWRHEYMCAVQPPGFR